MRPKLQEVVVALDEGRLYMAWGSSGRWWKLTRRGRVKVGLNGNWSIPVVVGTKRKLIIDHDYWFGVSIDFIENITEETFG